MSYSCAFGFVGFAFGSVEVVDSSPSISFDFPGPQPGSLDGTLSAADEFDVSNTLVGTCDEVYTLSGIFLDANTFDGELTVEFQEQSPGACFDCTDQVFQISGSR